MRYSFIVFFASIGFIYGAVADGQKAPISSQLGYQDVPPAALEIQHNIAPYCIIKPLDALQVTADNGKDQGEESFHVCVKTNLENVKLFIRKEGNDAAPEEKRPLCSFQYNGAPSVTPTQEKQLLIRSIPAGETTHAVKVTCEVGDLQAGVYEDRIVLELVSDA